MIGRLSTIRSVALFQRLPHLGIGLVHRPVGNRGCIFAHGHTNCMLCGLWQNRTWSICGGQRWPLVPSVQPSRGGKLWHGGCSESGTQITACNNTNTHTQKRRLSTSTNTLTHYYYCLIYYYDNHHNQVTIVEPGPLYSYRVGAISVNSSPFEVANYDGSVGTLIIKVCQIITWNNIQLAVVSIGVNNDSC